MDFAVIEAKAKVIAMDFAVIEANAIVMESAISENNWAANACWDG